MDHILCVSENDVHRANIQAMCFEKLPQTQANKITFLHPDHVKTLLEKHDQRPSTKILGYDVVINTIPGDADDMAYRKSRIKDVFKQAGIR